MARILVVDDQPVILKSCLKGCWSVAGILWSAAKTLLMLLEKMAEQRFELAKVITDAIMPGGTSGYDLVKTIRKIRKQKLFPSFCSLAVERKKMLSALCKRVRMTISSSPSIRRSCTPKSIRFSRKAARPQPISRVRCFRRWAAHTDTENRWHLRTGFDVNIAPHPLHPNSKVQPQSPLFEAIGITPPIIRVESCVVIPSGYLIRGQFV